MAKRALSPETRVRRFLENGEYGILSQLLQDPLAELVKEAHNAAVEQCAFAAVRYDRDYPFHQNAGHYLVEKVGIRKVWEPPLDWPKNVVDGPWQPDSHKRWEPL